LKRTNLLRLGTERPDVTHVETWNASTNASIIGLNDVLGYRLVARWQDRELWLDS